VPAHVDAGPLTDTFTGEKNVNPFDALPVQPNASVTVIVYVPVAEGFIQLVVPPFDHA
jgi:hypothetical protein